jgi:hypothetical protein
LRGQKKVSKEKATHIPLILRVLLLSRVFRTGFPALRKTRGIPAAPLRAMLDKSYDARAVCKGFKTMPSAIFPLRGFLHGEINC